MTVLRPLDDRIVVRRAKAEDKTPGGLFIPATAQKKSCEAIVVATGPGRRLDDGRRVEPGVKVGDRVVLKEWAGTEIKIDDVELLVVREDDLQGVIEP